MARTIKRVQKVTKPKKSKKKTTQEKSSLKTTPVEPISNTKVVASIQKDTTPAPAQAPAPSPAPAPAPSPAPAPAPEPELKSVQIKKGRKSRKTLLTDIDELRELARVNNIADSDKLNRRDLILNLNKAGVLSKEFLQQKLKELQKNRN
tara:strand:+ start:5903 stop:6349 length:447 start_codon:yes stop_codon:yes gene_type:complete